MLGVTYSGSIKNLNSDKSGSLGYTVGASADGTSAVSAVSVSISVLERN